MSLVLLVTAAPCGVLAQAALKLAPPAPTVPSSPAAPVMTGENLPLKAPRTRPQVDLLAGVRDHVSHLRAAPLPGGPQPLHPNSTQKAVEEVKILHNWNGEPASAGWSFNIKAPK